MPPLLDFANYFDLDMMFFDPNNVADMADKILEFNTNYVQMKIDGEENTKKIKVFDQKYFATEFLKILKILYNNDRIKIY